jgi:hypothetical protein
MVGLLQVMVGHCWRRRNLLVLAIIAALSSFPGLREGVSTPGQRWGMSPFRLSPSSSAFPARFTPLQGKGILGDCVGGVYGGGRPGGLGHVLRLRGGGQGIGRGKKAGKKGGKRSEERAEGPRGLTIDELDAERRRREEIEAEQDDGKVTAMLLPLNSLLPSHPCLFSLSLSLPLPPPLAPSPSLSLMLNHENKIRAAEVVMIPKP